MRVAFCDKKPEQMETQATKTLAMRCELVSNRYKDPKRWMPSSVGVDGVVNGELNEEAWR
jgi:hypothetical protein